MTRGSVGGVTMGNGWLRNNPDLNYPEGHEQMDDATLAAALTSPSTFSDGDPATHAENSHQQRTTKSAIIWLWVVMKVVKTRARLSFAS
jgi:hypothetical protein